METFGNGKTRSPATASRESSLAVFPPRQQFTAEPPHTAQQKELIHATSEHQTRFYGVETRRKVACNSHLEIYFPLGSWMELVGPQFFHHLHLIVLEYQYLSTGGCGLAEAAVVNTEVSDVS